jgi:YesN/AraC family two-component response regulator
MNTLLIVEDEKKIRQGIRTMALRSGVKIDRIMDCSDGEKALDVIQREPVDVMITDIRMPHMDGITLVKSMQSCRQVPMTIVLSGYDDFSYAVELMRCGVREYILKPVDREQLFSALRKMEGELIKKQAICEKTQQLSRQQLKYMMLNKEITQDELDVITEQFTHSLFRHAYVVVCAAPQDFNGDTRDGILFLGSVEGMAVYLAESGLKDFILNEKLNGLSTGVSLPHRELTQVRTAYEEAVKARRTAFAKCLPSAVYDGKTVLGSPQYEETMERILHLAGAGKTEEAIKYMEQITQNVMNGIIEVNNYAQHMKSLTDMIIARFCHMPGISVKEWEPLRSVFSYRTIRDHFQAFSACLYSLHEQMKNEEELSRVKEKIRLALTYVQENFQKGLNMAMVSNHVSMNYSQFSNAFKEYTGMNFISYLQDLRMTQAKHLLRTTDMKVFEISWKVGYGNEKHFMKTFRSICGISPTEYRKEGAS